MSGTEKVIDQLRRYITACTTPSPVRHPDYSLQKLKRVLDEYDAEVKESNARSGQSG